MGKQPKIKAFVKNLIRKRLIKKGASSEFYKSELPAHIASAVNSIKETAALSLALFVILQTSAKEPSDLLFLLTIFLAVFLLYKMCQTALAAWQRLNKLNSIIESEKYEIEHHRSQEKKELETIYSIKGFSGKLLEDVVGTLMADDNRLLQVMIEEEMGLTLGQFEHPLKQSFFAGLGVLFASCLILASLFFGSYFEFYITVALMAALASAVAIKEERDNISFIIFWNIASLAFLGFAAYFLTDFIRSLF